MVVVFDTCLLNIAKIHQQYAVESVISVGRPPSVSGLTATRGRFWNLPPGDGLIQMQLGYWNTYFITITSTITFTIIIRIIIMDHDHDHDHHHHHPNNTTGETRCFTSIAGKTQHWSVDQSIVYTTFAYIDHPNDPNCGYIFIIKLYSCFMPERAGTSI